MDEHALKKGDVVRKIETGELGTVQSKRYPYRSNEPYAWVAFIGNTDRSFDIPMPFDPDRFEVVSRHEQGADTWVELTRKQQERGDNEPTQ